MQELHRFFIPPDWIEVDRVTLPVEFVDQLTGLGLQVGDHFIVLDDSGWEYEVTLTTTGDGLGQARVVRRGLAPGERRTKIGLCQGLLPLEAFTELLQEGTRLGIVEFIPIITARSHLAEGDTFIEANMARWSEMIATVAAESGRGRLPRLRPAVMLETALDQVTRWGTSLMIWEGHGAQELDAVLEKRPFSIYLFAPPPDGFTSEEVARARQRGVTPIRPPRERMRKTPVGLETSRIIFERLG